MVAEAETRAGRTGTSGGPRPAARPRLRVLMTADTLGGVWTYALALADGLARHGVRVDLASMGRLPTPEQRARAARVPGLSLHAREFRLCWMDDPWDDLLTAADWLGELAERVRPDLVHLNDFGHAAMRWPAPVLLVAHSCVFSWWRAVHGSEPPRAWDGYRALVRLGLSRADRLVTPSGALREALAACYGPLPDCRVIPNGIAEPTAIAGTAKAPLVLASGRLWDQGKNIGALALAARDLPWPVVVAGDWTGPDGAVAELPNLVLTGPLEAEELARWYARASIFALPARYEPFGLGPLEAAQRGCALVLGDIPSLREVWGDAALYVPPDDWGALHAILDGLIRDPDQRRAWAARARQRAHEYGLARMTRGYLAAYRELCPAAAGCLA
jgi:glycosyltransferase involved in cell wall biosynthesis